MTGLLVGFAGVLVVLGAWRGVGSHALLDNQACLAAATCYGLGFPYTRRHLAGRPGSVVSLSAAQLLCATAQLTVMTPLLADAPRGLPARVVLSVVALGILGTGAAYLLNHAIIRAAGATVASTVTYMIPLFSTIAGVVVLGERPTWNQPVGALVVLVGVAVSQGRLGPLVRGR